ncbi:MAG TPA: HAD family hydrolase, partial [Lactococcus sp.]|nr:HAD family hydrolase [Lactococcus sp.]
GHEKNTVADKNYEDIAAFLEDFL